LVDFRSFLLAVVALADVAASAVPEVFRGTAASWTSSVGGNQKSQSFKTTATKATNRTPSAISIRLRWTTGSGAAGNSSGGVERRSEWSSS
jgi:hypothetical protein